MSLTSLPDDVLDVIVSYGVESRTEANSIKIHEDTTRAGAPLDTFAANSTHGVHSDAVKLFAASRPRYAIQANRLLLGSFAGIIEASRGLYCAYRRSMKPTLVGSDIEPGTMVIPGLGRELPRWALAVSATKDVRGGGTHREFVTNLLSDGGRCNWAKWFAVGGLPIRVFFDLQAPQNYSHMIFRGYALKTANDCPSRDPMSWAVRGLAKEDNALTTTQLDVVSQCSKMAAAARYQWLVYPLEEPVVAPFSLISFEFMENRGNNGECQLCQIALFGELLGGNDDTKR